MATAWTEMTVAALETWWQWQTTAMTNDGDGDGSNRDPMVVAEMTVAAFGEDGSNNSNDNSG